MADNKGKGRNRKGGRGKGNHPSDEGSVQSADTERVGQEPSATESVSPPPTQSSAPTDQVVEQLATMTLGSNSEETQPASKSKKKKKKKAKTDQEESSTSADIETPSTSSIAAQDVETSEPRSTDPSEKLSERSETQKPKTGPSEEKSSTTETQEPETETQSASKNKKKKKKKAKDDQGEQPTSAVVETPGPSSSQSQAQPSGKALEKKPVSAAVTTPGPSSTKSQGQPSSSKAPEKKPVSGSGERPASTVTTIPTRKIQGLISKGSKYFDASKNWTIEVNYLPIEFSSKNLRIFHYDVEFPERTAKSDFRALVNEMKRKHFPKRHPAFDGVKNLYAAAEPLFRGRSVTSTVTIKRENGSEKDFNVTIQEAHHDVDLTISSLYNYMKNGCSMNIPSATIQAIDVAIRGNLYDRFASCGRAFYTVPSKRIDLSPGLELYNGFVQSAILGHKPYLNVDVSHRGFYTAQPLLDYLEKLMTNKAGFNRQPDFSEFERGLTTNTQATLETYVKQNNGLRVMYTDPRTRATRRYRLDGLAGKPKDAIFEIKDGERPRPISVFDYYRTGKNYTIKYPNLPVLKTARGEYLPIECCAIDRKQPVPNRYQYSPDETRSMIGNCKDVPFSRKQKILGNIQNAGFNADPTQKEFGISIGSRGSTSGFLQVPAANLHPPSIMYQDGFAPVNNGVWEMKRFYNVVDVTNWIVLNMNERSSNDLNKLVEFLQSEGRNVGLNIRNPISPPLSLRRAYQEDIENMFVNLKKKYRNLELVVVVLPSFDTDVVYRRLKYISEIKVGILTQCVKPSTVQRMSWMTARNILLKINSKITGVNHILHYPNRATQVVLDGSTMFLGADVTHPPPGPKQHEEPSICAVAGSYDRHGFKYKMLYSVQSSKQEMIDGMERMVYELLKFFQDKNEGKLPTKLYYYRDGVSEGQFSQVLNIELRAVKAACDRINAQTKVALVIVQKRHHTRFFPSKEIADRKGNVLAGTVVNTEITHPLEHDFYLVSHQSIQGTARPTKYHVLYDEIGAPEDYVEALTYYLCYMFARCTRSVSYPAPTYYSHLAAERAGRYVKCAREARADLTLGPIGSGRIHADMVDKNPMYFV